MSDNITWLDFNSASLQSSEPVAAPEWTGRKYDRDEVKKQILGNLEGVLGYLYPEGFADPKGKKFYIGNISGEAGESLSVELSGTTAGLWHDFATGEGGDIFDLWKAARGLSSFIETVEDAGEYSGATANTPRRSPKRRIPKGGEDWGAPTATYNYLDTKGSIIAQVDRFEWSDGSENKKTFRPWDAISRQYKAPETRPLYNLPNIASAPEIIVVEGEKAADALIAQNIDATTAMGGANAPIEKTDWSILKGRKVIIWPDNDSAGKNYAERLKANLESEGALSVSILNIPSTRPDKWDAADAADEDLGAIIRGMRAPYIEPSTSRGFDFIRLGDLEYKEPEYLVDGLIETETLCSIFGAPGAGKSFFVFDLAACIATGTAFHGHDVMQGSVFVIAGEGKNGIKRRFMAWENHNRISTKDAPILISNKAAQMLDGDYTKEVTRVCEEYAKISGDPKIIILDTLARNFGPGDENSTMDMSKFVAAADSLKDKFPGCTMLIIHHTGHSDNQRSRGSIVLNAALDAEYRVSQEEGIITFESTKVKDGPKVEPTQFFLRDVEVGINKNGESVNSAALVKSDIVVDKKINIKPVTKQYLGYINDYFCQPDSHQVYPPMPGMPNMKTAKLNDVRNWCRAKEGFTEESTSSERMRWKRVLNDLKSAGKIGVWEDKIWLI